MRIPSPTFRVKISICLPPETISKPQSVMPLKPIRKGHPARPHGLPFQGGPLLVRDILPPQSSVGMPRPDWFEFRVFLNSSLISLSGVFSINLLRGGLPPPDPIGPKRRAFCDHRRSPSYRKEGSPRNRSGLRQALQRSSLTSHPVECTTIFLI